MNKDITVYSKPNCGGCKLVKAWLDSNEIPYTETNVFEDEEGMSFIADNGFMGLPVTLVGDNIVDGANPIELEKALNEVGHEVTL